MEDSESQDHSNMKLIGIKGEKVDVYDKDFELSENSSLSFTNQGFLAKKFKDNMKQIMKRNETLDKVVRKTSARGLSLDVVKWDGEDSDSVSDWEMEFREEKFQSQGNRFEMFQESSSSDWEVGVLMGV